VSRIVVLDDASNGRVERIKLWMQVATGNPLGRKMARRTPVLVLAFAFRH